MLPSKKVAAAIRRLCVLAVAIVLPINLSAPDALAKSRKSASFDLAPATAPSPAQPRFFTINSVLAKLENGQKIDTSSARLAALTPTDTATDTPNAYSAPQTGSEPFGLFTFRAPEGALWKKWRGVQADIELDREALTTCRTSAGECPPAAAQFLRLIKTASSKTGREILNEVNQGVNFAIRYASDLNQHGQPDVWSSPLASFASGRGDCEDYAIAKYVALVEAGFTGDLRLLLVRDRIAREDHAVLAASIEGHWLILDNRSSILAEDNDIKYLTPLFAIDQRGVQLFATPYASRTQPGEDGESNAMPASNLAGGSDWSGMSDIQGISAASSLPLFI